MIYIKFKLSRNSHLKEISYEINESKLLLSNFFINYTSWLMPERIYNLHTTTLRQWGFRQCLPLSWTTLRSKHCRHPIAVMGVVDTLGQ